MSKEMQIELESGLTDVYFVRHNLAGQVALTDGSAFEDWGTGGHDADDYDVAASEVGSGGCVYAADFDASSNIAAGYYTFTAFRKVGANPANGDDRQGSSFGRIIWNGTSEEEPGSLAGIITAIFAKTGITAGGTWTLAKILKVLAAWAAGDWQDKSGSPGTYEVLDAEDGTTKILEVTSGEESPQKQTTVS